MKVNIKRYKAAMKRKADKDAAAKKETAQAPAKQSSGSKAFDEAIDKMLGIKPKK